MADTKISGLTSLAAADVDTAADVLAIVDTGATATKKILVDDLRTAMGPKLETELATTSGTEKDFTIPSWAKRITVVVVGVSTNGTSVTRLQLGDSGGIETSGYNGVASNFSASSQTNLASGFDGTFASAAAVRHGQFILTLEDASDNTWACTWMIGRSDSAAGEMGAGTKALSGTLTTVRLTTANGTDAFDNGAVNLLIE